MKTTIVVVCFHLLMLFTLCAVPGIPWPWSVSAIMVPTATITLLFIVRTAWFHVCAGEDRFSKLAKAEFRPRDLFRRPWAWTFAIPRTPDAPMAEWALSKKQALQLFLGMCLCQGLGGLSIAVAFHGLP